VTSTPVAPGKGDAPLSPAPQSGWAAGRLAFATLLIATFGLFNVIEGIVAILRSHVFTEDTYYVIGNLRFWGWVLVLFGLLELVAAVAIADGRGWGRWFGVAMISLNILGQMILLPAYPFWSLAVVAADVVALYALCTYQGGPSREPVPPGDSAAWMRTPGDVPRPPA
jgi:hypothetical protein